MQHNFDAVRLRLALVVVLCWLKRNPHYVAAQMAKKCNRRSAQDHVAGLVSASYRKCPESARLAVRYDMGRFWLEIL